MLIRNESWKKLSDEFNKPYFKKLQAKIAADKKKGKTVIPFPYETTAFRAYEMTSLSGIKVVILGQDPYPNMRNATGLAFSVPAYEKAPASLRNIFKELKRDIKIDNTFNDLSYWAAQGVFLLNTVLTTVEGEAGAHSGYGWETFTDQTLKLVCQSNKFVVYCLFGNHAQEKEELIVKYSKKNNYSIIKAAHPSPLSAHKGFFFSRPFSKANKALISNGIQPINWRL